MKPGWTEVALGEVAEVLSGFAFDSTRFSRSSGLPLVRIRDVTRGWSETLYDGEFDPKFLIRDGDVLIGMDGEFKRSRWKGGQALLNQRVCRVSVDDDRVEERFLFHYLPMALDAIEARTPFVTVKHLSARTLKAIQVPLPPLEEQKRIAAILDKADDLLAKRRAAIAHLDSLTQAIFLDMFGDPASNPKRFPTRPLADVAQFLDHERRPITAADREPGPVPYFGANGVQGYVAEHLFDEPLVLVAEDGGYFDQPNRGIAYFIQGRSWVNNHAHVLRVSEDIDERFLTMAIRHRDVSQFLTGSTRAKLTKTAASRIPVAIPPFDRQVKFGELDQRTQELRDQQSGKLLVMSQLIASLQARAFRGEL